MPHFCSRNLDVFAEHAMHSVHRIGHHELSILSLPKNGKITAATAYVFITKETSLSGLCLYQGNFPHFRVRPPPPRLGNPSAP